MLLIESTAASFPVLKDVRGIPARGWEQTVFVELWSVSRPRLAEMAIEIWVMCQLKGKKPPRFDETSRFESLCRYLEIQVSQSISGSENGRRPALSRKRSYILNNWQ